jgi:hypothetical protein
MPNKKLASDYNKNPLARHLSGEKAKIERQKVRGSVLIGNNQCLAHLSSGRGAWFVP